MRDNKEEFIDRLDKLAVVEGCNSISDCLNIYRFDEPTAPTHGLFTAAICVVAQGAKTLKLANGDQFRYDTNKFILVSLDMPIIGQVVEATRAKPFLCLKMEFDPAIIASVCVEAGILPIRSETSMKSIGLGKFSEDSWTPLSGSQEF